METVGVRELRQQASSVLRRVADGESFVVTVRGRPIARLTPVQGGGMQELIAAGLVRMPKRSMRDAPPPIELPPGSKTLGEALAESRADER
jgi:prevent-host-death family protein